MLTCYFPHIIQIRRYQPNQCDGLLATSLLQPLLAAARNDCLPRVNSSVPVGAGRYYLAIVSESNSIHDWEYDVGNYGFKIEEVAGRPDGGEECYIRSLELRSRSTWNIYIRWVYIVMHDFIWVLFTEVCPSHVVRALVQLSEIMIEGTRRLSGYVDICPDLPSLVR